MGHARRAAHKTGLEAAGFVSPWQWHDRLTAGYGWLDGDFLQHRLLAVFQIFVYLIS